MCVLAAVFVPPSRPVRLMTPFRLFVPWVRPLITRCVEVPVRLVNSCRSLMSDPLALSAPMGFCVRCWLRRPPWPGGSRRLMVKATCRHGVSPPYSLLARILGRTRVLMTSTVVRANMRGRLGYVVTLLLPLGVTPGPRRSLEFGRLGQCLLT